MGRHKLPYKMKKPNQHHRYWRYVLSTDPHRSEISTKTKVKYEAERIAKEAYLLSIQEADKVISFAEYSKDFFTDKCKLTLRRQASNKPISPEILKAKRGQLLNHLQPQFGTLPLNEITQVMYEDWRMGYKLSNSTKNDITVVMNQIMKEAIRDGHIDVNTILNVECLNKTPENPRDALTFAEVKKLYPANYSAALDVWSSHYNYTMMSLLVTSGMRSGELRALKWGDVVWEDSGILITKAMKDQGKIGTTKEKKEKFVRIPHKTIMLLKGWQGQSKATGDDDFVFYGRYTDKPINRTTIRDIFKRGLEAAGIKNDRNLVPHCLRHTYNTFMLGGLPAELVRRFTGHSSDQMSQHYNHPVLKQELKATEKYQDKIDKIWG